MVSVEDNSQLVFEMPSGSRGTAVSRHDSNGPTVGRPELISRYDVIAAFPDTATAFEGPIVEPPAVCIYCRIVSTRGSMLL